MKWSRMVYNNNNNHNNSNHIIISSGHNQQQHLFERSGREHALVVTVQGEILVCGATCERHNGRQPVRNMHHHIADSASDRRREHGTVDETSDTRAALPDERFVASKRVIPRDPAGILPDLVVHVVSGRWRTVVTACE